MKAWFCKRFGSPDLLELQEVSDPVAGPHEFIVRVIATTVSTGDARIRGCRFPTGMGLIGRLVLGWNAPRQPILGSDAAGVVESVGTGVSDWKVGDEVLVVKGVSMRCHAQRILVKPGDVVVRKPANIGWAEAVSLPFGGQTARYFLSKAGVKAGDEVLVIGASGAVGSAALQWIAREGALSIAVTRAENFDWVRSLGASECLDYTQNDYRKEGRRFDWVMDCVGAGTFRTLHHLVKPGGAYLAVAGGLPDMMQGKSQGVRCITGYTSESKACVQQMIDLLASGAFRSMVGKTFTFNHLPAAHTWVDSGYKRGVAVVEMPTTEGNVESYGQKHSDRVHPADPNHGHHGITKNTSRIQTL